MTLISEGKREVNAVIRVKPYAGAEASSQFKN